jgi:hypothetical protein
MYQHTVAKYPDSAINLFKASRQGSSQRPTFNNTIVELHIIPRPKMTESKKCNAAISFGYGF